MEEVLSPSEVLKAMLHDAIEDLVVDREFCSRYKGSYDGANYVSIAA